MSDEGRRCVVTLDFEEYEARFIKFCQNIVYDGNGCPVGVERALVEKDDGAVRWVEPSCIKFIK